MKDRAYKLNRINKTDKDETVILDHVDSKVAENKFQKFSESKKEEDRYANLGIYTIDVKNMEAYLSSDPNNEDEKFTVERSSTYQRDTRSDPSRFNVGIAAESLKVGNKTEAFWIAK
jgi:hypothetical protein